MNKVFVNTIIQQKKTFDDSSGGHFTKWPTKSEYVSISPLLIHLTSKYFYLNIHFQGY